jgi:phage/plasmid-associated DNA primase
VPSSLQAQEAYRAASDPLRAFVKDCLRMPATTPSTGTKAKPCKTLTSAVFRAFLRYCEDHGYKALDDSYFGRALKELGLEATRSNDQRFYPVVLRDDDCEL